MHTASCPQPAGDVPVGPGPVGFQGDISFVALDNVFQLMDLAGLSGKLEVRSEDNGGTFYFTNGVFINGTLRINPRRIGAILLESGLITEAQLQEGLRLHEQSAQPQPLGQILLDRGYVDPGRLDDSLVRQIKEAFFSTLSWRQGSFVYYPGEMPAQTATHLLERVDHLLLEGMVYLDSLASS
ncbi:DUF4388 domain-containing protein [Desulfobulbus propionicus]|jgi:hypothetical protein